MLCFFHRRSNQKREKKNPDGGRSIKLCVCVCGARGSPTVMQSTHKLALPSLQCCYVGRYNVRVWQQLHIVRFIVASICGGPFVRSLLSPIGQYSENNNFDIWMYDADITRHIVDGSTLQTKSTIFFSVISISICMAKVYFGRLYWMHCILQSHACYRWHDLYNK